MEGFANYESSNDSESSSDDSEEGGDQPEATPAPPAPKPAAPAAPGKRKIPSAASALLNATAKPSFLNKDTHQGQVFELSCDEPAANSRPKDEPPAKKHAVEITPIAQAPTIQSRPKDNPKDRKDKDVKDKVKTQRMRGQSAHATWKSEGEMKLRQGYD